MINQQSLTGHWNEVRGTIKEKWGKLTEDDLRSFNGNIEQLIGRIQQKTGETREAIEEFLAELTEEGSDMLGTVREKVQETADGVRQGLRQGYSEAEKVVAERPGQAVALAFGLGLLAGVGVTLLLRERGNDTTMHRGRVATEQFGRQMLDSLASMLPESLAKYRG